MCITLLLITICVVIVIDLSGIVDDVETRLSKWLKGRVKIGKPWGCSFCMSHHISLVYLLCIGKLTLPLYTIILLFAFLTPVFSIFLRWVRDVLEQMVYWLYKAFKME